jgi:phosphate transport system substrate-binding protein
MHVAATHASGRPRARRRLIPILAAASLTAGLLPLVVAPAVAAGAPSNAIFDNTPAVLPADLPGQPFQAQHVSQFGADVLFAVGGRALDSVKVMMTSAARRSVWPSWPTTLAGGWAQPITLNLFTVDPQEPTQLASLISSVTQTFSVPWRPESDPTCPDTGRGPGFAWRAADAACHDALAFAVVFDLSSLSLIAPERLAFGVAFSTSDYGAAPLRTANPDGGPYDVLSVATYPGTSVATPASVGQFVPDDASAFLSASAGAVYCDHGVGGSGTFRLDAGCRAGALPAIQVNTQTPCSITCYVSGATGNDVFGGAAPGQAKRSLAAAVAQVVPGGTVVVAAGTYTETLDLHKGLTLAGPNAGVNPNTAIRGPEAVLAGGQGTTIRISTADPVTVDGFSFSGAQGALIDSYTAGNRPTIQNDIFSASADRFYLGNPSTVTFRYNSLHDLTDCAACDGLFILGNWNGATGTAASITGNVWRNVASNGVSLTNVSGTVSGNTFSQLVYYGLLLADGTSVDVTGNTFDRVSNPGFAVSTWGAGVRLYQPSQGFGARITNNVFSSNFVGVAVRMASPTVDLNGLDVQVHNNLFSGNAYGVRHEGYGILDATCNWWNSTGGPGAAGADPVLGPVTFTPWNSAPGGPCGGHITAPQTSVSLNGAFTSDMLAVVSQANAGFQAANPGTTVQLGYNTSDGALAALRSGSIPIAGISRPLTAAERGDVYAWRVGSDAMVFAVQDSSSMAFLTGLTSAQVRAIWSGTLTRWSQLGGPSAPIIPRSLTFDVAMRDDLLRLFSVTDLDEQTTVAATGLPRLEAPLRAASAVATTPYQIVYTSLAGAAQAGLRVVPLDGVAPGAQTVADGTYPAIRQFFIALPRFAGPASAYTDVPSAVKGQDLVNYLLGAAGQAAVGAANFAQVSGPGGQAIPDLDIDLNGGVGLTDIGQVTGRWNSSSPGVPGWIRADVDNSGGVGLTDIGRITGHWGQAGFTPPG